MKKANDSLPRASDVPTDNYLPCPICKGVEGCDHTYPERQRASIAPATAAHAGATLTESDSRPVGEIRIGTDQHPYAVLTTAYDAGGTGWTAGTKLYVCSEPSSEMQHVAWMSKDGTFTTALNRECMKPETRAFFTIPLYAAPTPAATAPAALGSVAERKSIAENGPTSKQAWWNGYRAGKGLPPDTPRQVAVSHLADAPALLTDEQIDRIASEACYQEAMEFVGSAKVADISNVVWAIRRALATNPSNSTDGGAA